MKHHLCAFLALATIAPAQTVVRQYPGNLVGQGVGTTICLPGDLDSDGVDDLIIGVPNPDGTSAFRGEFRAYSGHTGALLYSRAGTMDLAQLGAGGILALGDDNGDGVPDFLASLQTPTGGNDTQICSGVDGAILRTISGTADTLMRGQVLGDINQDGVPEIITVNPTVNSDEGVSRIYSGADGTVLRSHSGAAPGAFFGSGFAGLSDLNGDGVPDYAIGAAGPIGSPGAPGSVQVFSGVNGALLYEVLGSTPDSGLGLTVVGLPDVNADGVDDFIVAGYGVRDAGSPPYHGVVEIRSGVDGALIARVVGTGQDRLFGPSGGIGDYNDDGTPDFCLGSSSRGIDIRSGTDGSLIADFDGSAFGAVNLSRGQVYGGDLDDDGFKELIVVDSLNSSFFGRVTILERQIPSGGRICQGPSNSTGSPALLTANSPSGFSASAGDLTLQVTQLPMNSMGFFFVSSSTVMLLAPNGTVGNVCIAGTRMGRFVVNILDSGTTGTVTLSPDIARIPMGNVYETAMPGSVYNFQYWYRDQGPQGPTSSFSDARTITFQ